MWQEFHFPPGVPVDIGSMRWEVKLGHELMSRIPALKEYQPELTTREKRIKALEKARAAKKKKNQ